MTTSTTESEKPDGNSDTSSAPDGEQGNNWESERSELIARRDSANKKARLLAKELEDLKGQLASFEKKGAEESGDITKIREQFQKELDLEKQKTETLSKRLRNSVIKNAFLAEAPKHFVDKSIDQVWRLLESDFDIEQSDEGDEKIVVKNSALTFQDHLKRFAQENDYLAKNPGKPGDGVRNENGSNGTVGVPKDFNNWGQEQQSQWMKANPDAAKKMMKGIGW